MTDVDRVRPRDCPSNPRVRATRSWSASGSFVLAATMLRKGQPLARYRQPAVLAQGHPRSDNPVATAVRGRPVPQAARHESGVTMCCAQCTTIITPPLCATRITGAVIGASDCSIASTQSRQDNLSCARRGTQATVMPSRSSCCLQQRLPMLGDMVAQSRHDQHGRGSLQWSRLLSGSVQVVRGLSRRARNGTGRAELLPVPARESAWSREAEQRADISASVRLRSAR